MLDAKGDVLAWNALAITLDCDVLLLPGTDQRLVVCSAAPGTPAAEALAVVRVVGIQQLTP